MGKADAAEIAKRLRIRSKQEREEDEAAGRAVVEHILPKDYLGSYSAAASVLRDYAASKQAHHMLAMPAFFLQRHTLELALKSLLDVAYGIFDFEAEATKLRGRTPVRRQVSGKAKWRLGHCHDLRELLKDLDKHLPMVGESLTPPELRALVEKVATIEDGNPALSRYPTTPDGKSAFRSDVVLPLKEIQEDLEQVIYDHCVWEGAEPENLLDRLLQRMYSAMQEVDYLNGEFDDEL